MPNSSLMAGGSAARAAARRAVVLATLWGVLASAAGSAPAAEEREGWFEFAVPALSGPETAGSEIDMSFLSPGPAGAHGFLGGRGEALVDSHGREVRLFGTNVCDFHAMPPKDLAPRIARRLRELGVNFIRLHYFDWAPAPKGILNADMQTLAPEKLDQLDWLVAKLKENGVYVDVNLHVARGFREMPPEWDWMGKGVGRLHRPYIDSQKRYARDLLTHVNPYTGKAYTDEPAVAVIEIDNENTTLIVPMERWASLPERFAGPLRAEWNAWLKEKYRSTKTLVRAWNADPPHGPELVRDAALARGCAEWTVESAGGAQATVALARDEGGPFLRWCTTRPGSEFWNLQVYQKSVPVEDGRRYVLRFRARSPEGRELRVSLMHQAPPWKQVGSESVLGLTPGWRDYACSWQVKNDEGVAVRLNLSAGNVTGTFDVGGPSLREGGVEGLGEGETLEEGTVPLVRDRGCPERTADYVAFLAGMDRRFAHEMISFVKDELGAKQIAIDTQASYGGLTGLAREGRHSDALDNHCYSAHPSPVPEAEGGGWRVRNESLLAGAWGPFESQALARAPGKPFFMTEFDLNPPNDHASESYLVLNLMAAYQGWSATGEYSWLNFQGDYDPRRIHSYFSTTGHAGQMALVPASAMIFRRGLVRRAAARATIEIGEDSLAPLVAGHHQWYGPAEVARELGHDASLAWRTGVATKLVPGDAAPRIKGAPPAPEARGLFTSDTGELTLDRREKGREHLTVNAPAARVLVGYVGGRAFTLGDVRIEVAPGTRRGHANVSLVSLDSRPVARSRKLLLTAVARVENRGQRWNADRTSVGRDWGEGPTLAEPVRATVTLPGRGWRARALDGAGRAKAHVKLAGPRLTTGSHGTVWYLIER